MCIAYVHKPSKKYKIAYKGVEKIDDYYIPLIYTEKVLFGKICKPIKYYLNKTSRIFFNKYDSKIYANNKIDKSGFHLFISLASAKIYAGHNTILKCEVSRVKWEGITIPTSMEIDTIIAKKFKPIEEIQ